MLTFVIFHNSEVVALLIAVCLQLFHGTSTKILIVKLFNGDQAASVVAPWCGVSTDSEVKNQTWRLHNHPSLMRILSPSLLFMDRFRLEAVKGNAFMTPDLPIPTQKMQILAELANTSSKPSALCYNPVMLADNLRQFLLSSLNVSFLSVPSNSALLQLLHSLPDKVVLMDFLFEFDLSRNWQLLSAIESSVLSHMSPVRFSRNFEGLSLPSSILWLPMFKASTGMCPTSEVNCRYSYHGNVIRIEVVPTNLKFYEQEVCSKYDLMYSFGICDKILDTLGTILRVPSKL